MSSASGQRQLGTPSCEVSSADVHLSLMGRVGIRRLGGGRGVISARHWEHDQVSLESLQIRITEVCLDWIPC